ncbi:hypothetical protein [Dipodfec virus UA23Rod_963]|uniref:Uncharacterized protein n=1 Tax=Dipodfec virus UA23Rod_963 TaxID=2929335 RepID=A0A976N265_9VIRU|nr:hypothetical protein [Dipodfec virus UA23Rod_963]
MRTTLIDYHSFIFFIDYLAQRSAFYQFYNSFRIYGDHEAYPTFFKYITSVPPEKFISSAFRYDETLLGSDYWKDIDKDWRLFLIKNLIQL